MSTPEKRTVWETNKIITGGCKTEITLTDDQYIDLPADVHGIGLLSIQHDSISATNEYVVFCINENGDVTLINNSTNVASTDSDTDFCVFYYDSTNVRIKNRLGYTVRVIGSISFNGNMTSAPAS